MTISKRHLLLGALSIGLLAGCASADLRGAVSGPPITSEVPPFNGLVYIVFMDQTVFEASGLSALRVGVPKQSVGNDRLTHSLDAIARHIVRSVPDLSIRIRLQSEVVRSPVVNAAYVVVVAPRTLGTTPTGMHSDAEVQIRDERTKTVGWKGTVTITHDPRNNEAVARELLRVMKEYGLTPKMAKEPVA